MSGLNNRARRLGIALLLVNSLLIILKLAALTMTSSVALRSEIVNSGADIIYSLVTVAGLTAATRTPTETYPEGFRKLEPIISLLIAAGIFLSGVYLIHSSITEIFHPTPTALTPLVTGSLLVTAVIKAGVYWWCTRKTNVSSPIITATAHDSLADILTATVAFIGIASAAFGAPMADGVAGAIVAVSIGYAGVEIARENTRYLLGGTPDDQTKQELVDTAMTHAQVWGVHDVVIHHNGPEVDVSMHLEVPGGLTIEAGHEIEYAVADSLREETDYPVNEINLHLDPQSLGEWESEAMPGLDG